MPFKSVFSSWNLMIAIQKLEWISRIKRNLVQQYLGKRTQICISTETIQICYSICIHLKERQGNIEAEIWKTK